MINGTQNVPTNDFPLKSLPNVNQPITKIGILIRNCVNAGLNSYISNKMVLTPDMPPAASLAGNKNILYPKPTRDAPRSEEHTSELQSRGHLVCRLLLEKKKKNYII